MSFNFIKSGHCNSRSRSQGLLMHKIHLNLLQSFCMCVTMSIRGLKPLILFNLELIKDHCTCSLCFFSNVNIRPLDNWGAQWLSGRVLDSRPRGCRFVPHCIVSLSKTHLSY